MNNQYQALELRYERRVTMSSIELLVSLKPPATGITLSWSYLDLPLTYGNLAWYGHILILYMKRATPGLTKPHLVAMTSLEQSTWYSVPG